MKGIIKYIDESLTIFANRNRLTIINTKTNDKKTVYLPYTNKEKLKASNRILARLFRANIHHCVRLSDIQFVVFAFKNTYVLDIEKGTIDKGDAISGSRPLCVCVKNGTAYYGEYLSNQDRNPIKVWKTNNGLKWDVAYAFNDIRHIHGVFYDKYTDSIWVTTGDEDNESYLWQTTDHFKTVKKVTGGTQLHRAVQLLFTEDYIYYGSDDPHKHNYICRIRRADNSLEKLFEVVGTVFYGTVVNNKIFFSTVVENSNMKKNKDVELIMSENGKDWRCIKKFKKDFLSKRYFQYGQILFPSGSGDQKNLWYVPFAVRKYDHKTLKLSLS